MRNSVRARVRRWLVAPLIVVAAMLGAACTGTVATSSAPQATSTPVQSPQASEEPGLAVLSGDPIEPGSYRLTAESEPADAFDFPAGSTITVPAGWSAGSTFRVIKETVDGATTMVGFWPWGNDLAHVYTEPCQWRDNEVDPPVGPTVDDLANALAAQEQRGDAVPVDVSIGGYSGKMVEMTVPSDVDFATCDDGEFRSWLGRFHQGPGQVDEVYVLDVDGERVVLLSFYFPATPEADLAERQAIIDSIQLGAP